MSTENQKPSTKKWIDYSDDSEQEEVRHQVYQAPKKSIASTKTIDKEKYNQDIDQFELLQKCTGDTVWMHVKHTQYDDLIELIYGLKNQSSEYRVYENKFAEKGWNLKVTYARAKKLLQQGLQQKKRLMIIVSEQNFRKQYDNKKTYNNNNNNKRQYQRRDYKQGEGQGNTQGQQGHQNRGRGRGRGRGGFNNDRGGQRNGDGKRQYNRDRPPRGDRNDDGKKKVYKDKETGQLPDNKKNLEKRLMQQKQRHYSKKQAENLGLELGNFRNTPLQKRAPMQLQQKKYEPKQQKQYKQPKQYKKPQAPVQIWARKDEKKRAYKQKQQGETKEDMTTADNTTSNEPQVIKQKKTYKKKDNDNRFAAMISEDSDNN